jgi:peptidoglycan/LPS O-acetylase OafA/YrhL
MSAGKGSSLRPCPNLNDKERLFWCHDVLVVSGFLITSASLQRYGRLRSINPVNFYWFRFARIAPCLVLVLTVLVALHYSGNPYFKLSTGDYSVLGAVIHALTFRFNALLVHFGWNINVCNILWSLSIEEAFYICFPLICMSLCGARLFADFPGIAFPGRMKLRAAVGCHRAGAGTQPRACSQSAARCPR